MARSTKRGNNETRQDINFVRDAICEDCGWKFRGSIQASRLAVQHCRDTGHEVRVDSGPYFKVVKIVRE